MRILVFLIPDLRNNCLLLRKVIKMLTSYKRHICETFDSWFLLFFFFLKFFKDILFYKIFKNTFLLNRPQNAQSKQFLVGKIYIFIPIQRKFIMSHEKVVKFLSAIVYRAAKQKSALIKLYIIMEHQKILGILYMNQVLDKLEENHNRLLIR